MRTYGDFGRYGEWVRRFDTLDHEDRKAIQDSVRLLDRPPLFSVILLPWTNLEPSLAYTSIASICRQLYPHWELWLPHLPDELETNADQRLRTISALPPADGVRLFNAALAKAEGDYVLPLPSNAILGEAALFELATLILEFPGADLLYSDEDHIDASDNRYAPRFKTDWDPDLALGRDAIGLLVAYRRTLVEQLGGMDVQTDVAGLGTYDLSLRVAFATTADNIHHIPAVLCHRRCSVGYSSGWDAERAREIVRKALTKLGEHAAVVPAPLATGWSRIVRELPNPAPLVTIIVPTRDHAELLEHCTESVLSCTAYPKFELLIVDNGSSERAALQALHRLSQDQRVRILPFPYPFNYATLNNMAAREARGEVLVLLNNDIKVIQRDWLLEMVSHAARPDVGAVGAKLLYPDNRIQHAGMVLGPGIYPQHQLRFADNLDVGPFGELCLTRTVSAVTGACVALRQNVFLEVGGLDERLMVSYSDVDLCMRIGDCGYRVVWTPFAELIHLESVSRGPDDTPEKQTLLASEVRHFWRSWQSWRRNDPFHNPNLMYVWDTVNLSWPPRRRRPWQK